MVEWPDAAGGMRGADLAGAFHADLVGPLLAQQFPGLRYAAGRMGSGSDVLGLDDEMSRDHDWGLRLTILVDEDDRAVVPEVVDLLERVLPDRYRGMPVRFPMTGDPSTRHRVGVDTVGRFAAGRLAVNPLAGLSTIDWLVPTGQGVLELTAGPVFVDTTRELARVRTMLRWYPPDVERYVLAASWQRLAEYFPMVGRTAASGDDLGSRLLSSALASDLMRLAFLLHRRWPPYRKWLGTLFSRLLSAPTLTGPLRAAVTAGDWREREGGLAEAAGILLRIQRDRGLPTPASGVTAFWDRPYRTVDSAVPAALYDSITDPDLSRLPLGIGSLEQWVDNVQALSPERRAATAASYRAWLATR
jgi:hypothetical protein